MFIMTVSDLVIFLFFDSRKRWVMFWDIIFMRFFSDVEDVEGLEFFLSERGRSVFREELFELEVGEVAVFLSLLFSRVIFLVSALGVVSLIFISYLCSGRVFLRFFC